MRKSIVSGKSLITEPEEPKRAYPVDRPIVQYIRQSTGGQVKNNKQSAILQDAKLSQKLIRLGFKNIIKEASDQGKSGQKRPDERGGLDETIKKAKRGEVGAFAAYDASRLYRDLTRVYYTDFVNLLETYQIPLITYARTYWPNSRDDMSQLIRDFEEAANYITNQIKGKNLVAKALAIEEGQSYGGHSVPMGYILAEKEFDGSFQGVDTFTRKYYTIYEPHAKIVRWLFRRYRELGGNLPRLGRELRDAGFRFPPFEGVNKIPHVSLRWDGSGYSIRTRGGLEGILTNVAYIGWYVYDGVVISKTSHDPIVPMDDFMYAFSRLSDTTLDGEPNENKPKVERRKGTANALLDGLLTSDGNPVYAMAARNCYIARLSDDGWNSTELVIGIPELDTAFSNALVKFLATLELRHRQGLQDSMYDQLNELQEKKEEEVISLEQALENIDKRIRQIERDKRLASEQDYEQGVIDAMKELKHLYADRKAVEAKARQADTEEAELAECKTLIQCAVENWNGLPFERQHRFAQLCVLRANISKVAPHFVKLEVDLKEPLGCTLTGHIFRSRGKRPLAWNKDEEEVLCRMYQHSNRLEILQALPGRSWVSVENHASEMHLKGVMHLERHKRDTTSAVHEALTYDDYVLMGQVGINDINDPYWTYSSLCPYNLDSSSDQVQRLAEVVAGL